LWQKFINVTTKPGAQSFTNELPTANWSDIWIALLGLGVIVALTGFVRSLYVQAALAANYPLFNGLSPDQQHAFDQILSSTGSGAASVGAIIWTPLGFFVGMGILFVSAKIFSGSGSFLDQSYAFMLYYVPINGLGAVLGLIPVLGGFATFALWIYSIVLSVFAMMASQRLSGGRAVAAVLLPAAIVTLLICGLLTVIVIALAGVINGTH
jgi:hypothetical protein